MTPRRLAAATKALREAGSREIPIAAARLGVIGEFRRQVIGVLLGILSVPVLSYVFDLDSKPYLVELLLQVAIAVVMVTTFVLILMRTTKGDPTLQGARSGMVVVTSKGLRLFSAASRRRVPELVLTLPLDDLVLAHIEPRGSIFDLPRFVFGHAGGTMAYELQGKDVLQLTHAIERLEEPADL